VPASWYLKGLACMRIVNFAGALEAFTRCVQQDMEIGEAWGNLGAIHMHCRRFERAYECLIEAQKHRAREWRLMENLLTVCLETGRYGESLEFMKKLLELRHSKSNAIDKNGVANNCSNADTSVDHPTPVHLSDLRALCSVVALQTLQDARQQGAAVAVLPRLTTELETFLLKILTVMHTDSVYYEVIIMYHGIILVGGEVGKPSSNDCVEDHISPAELWLRERSKSTICEYRLKQFRVLLNQPNWEKNDKSVSELLRVGKELICCHFAKDNEYRSKKDDYQVKSMFKTAYARLEKFYDESRQLEGSSRERKAEDLNLLRTYISFEE